MSLNLLIVGHGRMGQAVEAAARERGHNIAAVIDAHNTNELDHIQPGQAGAAIEFTEPGSAMANYRRLLAGGIPVVTGTTGWYDQLPEVHALAEQHQTGFLHAANFSIGVNLLFALNRRLAQLMNAHPHYDPFVEEAHHRYKKDAPSGTAGRLCNDILAELDRKTRLATTAEMAQRPPAEDELSVAATRAGEIPGTHRVVYTSAVDELEVRHQAFGRQGFALGAVIAAEWLVGRTGVHEFAEVLNLEA